MAAPDPLKEELDRIEREITRLKKEYDSFFRGRRRSEPGEERRAVEGMIRRIGQRRIVNTTDQFRFNNVQSRFYAFVNLWARMVRELEEGRLSRDDSGAVIRPAAPAEGAVDPDHLDRVLDQLREARRACGLPAAEPDLAAIRQTLLDRADQIARTSGQRRVEFKVSVEGGKPKVKALMARPGGPKP